MTRFRETRVAAFVAAMLVLTMYIAPTIAAARSKGQTVVRRTLVVFPFQVPEETPNESLGQDLASSLVLSLDSPSGYQTMLLSKRIPSVRRALSVDNTLKESDLEGPFGTEKEQIESALKIGRETGADYMLVGSIEDVKVDVAAKKASIAVSAAVVDIRSGETVKMLVVTGLTPENAKSDNEKDLISLAAGDAVKKIVAETGVIAAQVTPQPVVSKKSNSTKKMLLWGLLLGLAVGVASGGSSSGGSGGIDNPPPPPF